MKHNVTKQKLYERLVLDTFRYSSLKAIATERNRLEAAGYDLFSISFDELRMARAILGLDLPISDKQPFDRLGFGYFAQITGFTFNLGDDRLVDMYFSVLNNYPGMVDFSDAEQAGFMYDVFCDFINKDRSVCCRLGSYLFRHAENCDWYPKFLSVAYGLSMFDNDIDLPEIMEMKKKHPLSENDKIRSVE